jgi:DNA modification methylase
MKPAMPTIIRGDARRLPLPDASVDLIVTSPPYFGLRAYQDGGEAYDGQIGAEATPREFIDALIDCTREWVRVLKPSGSIFVNLGDTYDKDKSLLMLPERYRIAVRDELRLIARATIIWDKPNAMPASVTDRVNRTHEDWVHLTQQPRYYAAMDEIREAHEHHRRDAWDRRPDKTMTAIAANGSTSARMGNNPLGKLPGSVWEIPTQPLKVPAGLGVDHFAAYPPALVRPIIRGWSPVDGSVLDPFSGTGTTALVATMLGRTGIGVDLSADYCRLAQWRASDPKERARAAGLDPDAVAKVAPQLPGQFDLFGQSA